MQFEDLRISPGAQPITPNGPQRRYDKPLPPRPLNFEGRRATLFKESDWQGAQVAKGVARRSLPLHRPLKPTEAIPCSIGAIRSITPPPALTGSNEQIQAFVEILQQFVQERVSIKVLAQLLEENKPKTEEGIVELYHALRSVPNSYEILKALFQLACKNTSAEAPLRENALGIKLFIYYFDELLTKKLGERFFASITKEAVLEVITRESVSTVAPSSPEVEKVQLAKKRVLERVAVALSQPPGEIDSLIKSHAAFLGRQITIHKIEKMTPEGAVLNFFFLRCLNPAILRASTLLEASVDPWDKCVGNFMKCISICIQKEMNKANLQEQASDKSVDCIKKYLLSGL